MIRCSCAGTIHPFSIPKRWWNIFSWLGVQHRPTNIRQSAVSSHADFFCRCPSAGHLRFSISVGVQKSCGSMGDPDASPSWGLYQAWGFPIRYLSRAGELNELGMMTWGWIPFEWTRFVLNQLVNHNLFLNVAWNCGLNPTPPFSDTPGWSAGRVICPWAPCDLSFSMQCIGMQTRPQLGQVGQVDCKRSEHFLSCNIIYIYDYDYTSISIYVHIWAYKIIYEYTYISIWISLIPLIPFVFSGPGKVWWTLWCWKLSPAPEVPEFPSPCGGTWG